MGLIDFVKEVGHKLHIGPEEKPATQASQGQHPQVPGQAAPQGQGPTAQQVHDLENRKKATALNNLVQQMGLHAENLNIAVDGEKATVSGQVDSLEAKEKIVLLIGNTEGISKVDDQLQVKQQAQAQPAASVQQAQFYDVKPGDTLSKIAKQFYGDANQYNRIFEANKPMLKDPDKIFPGQKLRIPAATTANAHA